MKKLRKVEGYDWLDDPRYAMKLADGTKVHAGDLKRQVAVVIKTHIRLCSPENETRRAGADVLSRRAHRLYSLSLSWKDIRERLELSVSRHYLLNKNLKIGTGVVSGRAAL